MSHNVFAVAAIVAGMLAAVSPASASAQIVAEGSGARAEGRWGGEVGVGYGIGAAGFRLTPIVGALVADGDTRVFGKAEATYSIPLVATVGAGVRVSERDTTPYATAAVPIFPFVRLKGNVGDGYYALGLRISL